jgi:hypothetical protein
MEYEPSELALHNDHTIRVLLEEIDDPGTGRQRPLTGAAPIGFISATDDVVTAAAIGALSVPLTAGGVSGRYFGTIAGSNINETELANYIGKDVYEMVKIGSQLRATRTLRVVRTRTPLNV